MEGSGVLAVTDSPMIPVPVRMGLYTVKGLLYVCTVSHSLGAVDHNAHLLFRWRSSSSCLDTPRCEVKRCVLSADDAACNVDGRASSRSASDRDLCGCRLPPRHRSFAANRLIASSASCRDDDHRRRVLPVLLLLRYR